MSTLDLSDHFLVDFNLNVEKKMRQRWELRLRVEGHWERVTYSQLQQLDSHMWVLQSVCWSQLISSESFSGPSQSPAPSQGLQESNLDQCSTLSEP